MVEIAYYVGSVIVAAVAALLSYAGRQMMRNAFVNILEAIPIIGRGIANYVDQGLLMAQAIWDTWMESSGSTLGAVISSPWQRLDHVLTQIEATFRRVIYGQKQSSASSVRQVVENITGPMENQINSARSWIHAEIDQQNASISGISSRTGAAIAAGQAATRAYIDQRFGAEAASTQAALNSVEAATRSALTVQANAEASARAALAGQVTAGLSLANTRIADVQAEAASQAAEDLSTAQRYTDARAAALASQVASVGAIAAEAGAAARAAAERIAADEEECIQPLCDSFKGSAQAWKGISGLIGEGVLLAALTEVVTDPTGAAAIAKDVLEPLGNTWYNFVKSL